MDSKKIIILASERSGTNLFRTLLGKHKDISGPVAPHFFDAFSYDLPRYGDLSNHDNSLLMLDHMTRLANHDYHGWKLSTSPEELMKKYQVNSFETAFDALYQEKASLDGKMHYTSKDNHLFNYSHYLNKLENIKYLYLYRDPRDHVASWLRTPLFMHTSFDIIIKWIKEQKTILKIAEDSEVCFVSYESLIQDTPKAMTEVLDFIGVDIDENCFTTNNMNEESKRNEFWKNLSKPIIKDNLKKYKKVLSKRDIKIIESKAKEIMELLNYDLDTPANWKAYKGFGYELKLRRKISEKKHRDLLNKKMADLQDKLKLIEDLRSEIE